MYLKYQIPYRKIEPGETGIEATYRKIVEETNLLIKPERLHYFANNSVFDCNIYFAKLREGKIPERTEPQNIGSWLYYLWIIWYDMTTRRQTTSILTTFRDTIDNIVRMF